MRHTILAGAVLALVLGAAGLSRVEAAGGISLTWRWPATSGEAYHGRTEGRAHDRDRRHGRVDRDDRRHRDHDRDRRHGHVDRHHGHHGGRIVVAPRPWFARQCWMPGHWAQRWVPRTSSYAVWVPGAWSPAGYWVAGHYASYPYTTGAYQSYWVEGHYRPC